MNNQAAAFYVTINTSTGWKNACGFSFQTVEAAREWAAKNLRTVEVRITRSLPGTAGYGWTIAPLF